MISGWSYDEYKPKDEYDDHIEKHRGISLSYTYTDPTTGAKTKVSNGVRFTLFISLGVIFGTAIIGYFVYDMKGNENPHGTVKDTRTNA